MSFNVNRSVQDSYYRYKMPALIAKVEGKGNGIKTVIVNMADVAKALARPPSYVNKFFGIELGSPSTIDTKNERFIVNGEHTAMRLQELLDEFIKKYVLCANCGNPETVIRVTKAQKLEASCKACGHVFPMGLTHKLTLYILKDLAESKSSSKTSKAERRAAKAAKGEKDDGSGAEEEEQTPAESSPPSTPVKEKKSKSKSADLPEVDDTDWSADTSEQAVRERAEKLAGSVAAVAATDDLDKSTTERLELFFEFVKNRMSSQPKLVAKEIVSEAERLDCKDKACMVLVELLLDSDTDVLAHAKTHVAVFQRFVVGNAKAQKYMLGALEKLAERYAKVAEKFANILKGLYDLDILEEEAILEWGAKVSKKYVSKELSTKLHDVSAKFLKWLQETEEEESESSDDDDDDDVSFNAEAAQPAKPEPAKYQMPASSAAASAPSVPAAADDDEEIDIDAI